jgi:trans-aconitate methyltransferase
MDTKLSYGQEYADFAEKSFSWHAIEKPAIYHLLAQISELNPGIFVNHPRIFDLGIGPGRLVHPVQAVWPRAEITGIDSSDKMLALAAEKYPNIDLISGDFEIKFSTSNGSDLIIAHMVMQFLSRDRAAGVLQMAHHELLPRGFILLGVPHAARLSPDDYFRKDPVEVRTPWGETETCYPRTISEYSQLLRDSNFQIVAIEEPSVQPEARDHPEAAPYLGSPSRLYILARKA